MTLAKWDLQKLKDTVMGVLQENGSDLGKIKAVNHEVYHPY